MAKNLPIGYVEERRTAGRSSTFTKYSMAHFKKELRSQIDPTKSANYKKRNSSSYNTYRCDGDHGFRHDCRQQVNER